LTVSFSPVGVDTVKPDADTAVTVPTDPPAAFVVRALDPPPPDSDSSVEHGLIPSVVW